jgi:hypothetical protein
MVAFCIIFDLFIAYKYPICGVFNWFCKISRFFATEPKKITNKYLHKQDPQSENHLIGAKALDNINSIPVIAIPAKNSNFCLQCLNRCVK